jgi:hypothetical protein
MFEKMALRIPNREDVTGAGENCVIRRFVILYASPKYY